MTSVIDQFGLTLICWRDYGDCNVTHYSHVHISLGVDYHNARPKCDGGRAGYLGPSPDMVKFRDELYRRFPKLHAPGGGDGILNCRPVDGTTSWSNHAYGTAIDVTTDGSSSTLIAYLNKVYVWLNGQWEEEDEMAGYSEKIGLDDATVGNAMAFLAGQHRRRAGNSRSSVAKDGKSPKTKLEGWDHEDDVIFLATGKRGKK